MLAEPNSFFSGASLGGLAINSFMALACSVSLAIPICQRLGNIDNILPYEWVDAAK